MGKSSNNITTTIRVLLLLFLFFLTPKKPHATAACRDYIIRNTMKGMKKKQKKTGYSLVSSGNNGGDLYSSTWAKI
jgi:hypothetical protein